MYTESIENMALELVFSTLSPEDRGACSFVCKEWSAVVRRVEKSDYCSGWKIKDSLDFLEQCFTKISIRVAFDVRMWCNAEDLFNVDMRYAATARRKVHAVGHLSPDAQVYYALFSLLRTKHHDTVIRRLRRFALFHPDRRIEKFISTHLVPRLEQKIEDKGVRLIVGSTETRVFYSSVEKVRGIEDVYVKIANLVASVMNADITMEVNRSVITIRNDEHSEEKKVSFHVGNIKSWEKADEILFALVSTKSVGRLTDIRMPIDAFQLRKFSLVSSPPRV